jgi:site-specific recombinase XerD
MKRIILTPMLADFKMHLVLDEKSENTVKKYLHDIGELVRYAEGREMTRELVLDFKKWLAEKYELTSANSMIAAANAFFRFCGWSELCIKQFKIQRKAFCSQEKELTRDEYFRLLTAAKQKGNERLDLVLQTICGTGIRVSELQFITVEAVRKGEATVSCKNKTRTVFIVRGLQKKLLNYAKRMRVATGCLFVTKTGQPLGRCNIWREMKRLCADAHVSPAKVFPHNLRHLFARTFYGIEKDIAKLADILGHSNINTTRIYIVTTGEEHKRKMENMRLII